MRSWARRAVPALVGGVLLLVAPAGARADDAGRNLAEELFREGRALMQQKDYAHACPKFEEGYSHDRTAYGTLLNLALCHEALGRTASAWAEFLVVASQSRGTREDRVRISEEHAAALEPKRSWLRIEVPPEAQVPGLRVTLDGHELGPASLGTELPVDPGPRDLLATAPGKRSWHAVVDVGPTADHQRVAVGVLADVVTPLTLDEMPPPGPAADASASGHASATPPPRLAGFVMAGMGGVGLGAGLVIGLLAINKNSEARGKCTGDLCPDALTMQQATDGVSSAKGLALASSVVTGVSLAALGAGIVLVLVSPPSPGAAPRAWLAPTVGGPGLSAGTTF